jgi:hypothetical protein
VPDPTSTSPILVTVTFSEPVTGFNATKISPTNGSVSGFAVSGPGYTFLLTPSSQGPVSADIAAGAAQDLAGNSSTAATPFTRTFDSIAPTVTMTSPGVSNPTNTSPIPVTVTFSEPVTGFTSSSITATNGGVSGFTGSGASYSFSLTPAGQGIVTAAIAANVAQDQAGNNNTAAAPFTRTYDSVAPAVTFIKRADADPTNASGVNFTVTFSKPVTGVTAASFSLTSTVTGATIGTPTGGGAAWTVPVNTGSGSGTIRLDATAAGTTADAAGNALGSLPFTTGQVYTIDRTAPIVSSIAFVGPSPTNAASVNFTVTFSKPVTGVTAASFSLASTVTGATIGTPTGGGAAWTVPVNTGSGSGTIRLDATAAGTTADAVGNALGSLPFNAGTVVTIDKTPPTVSTIALVGTSPTNAASVSFTVTFSKSVTGVTAASFSLTSTVTGATIGTPTGSGTAWTVPVNTGTGDGTLRLDATAAGTTADLLGNALGGLPFTTGGVFTIDKTAPSIAVSGPSVPTATTGPVSYTVTYTGADTVTLGAGDVTLVRTGTATGSVGVSGAGTGSRTVTISAITGNGTLAISIAAGTASDLAGNAAPAAPASATFAVNNTGTIGLPSALQVESLTNPTLVGRSPGFTGQHNWTGAVPSDAVSFRTQVSTNSTFSTITHWNSPSSGTLFPGSATVAAGARSPEIRYGTGGNQSGAVPSLSWNQQYFWRVEFRDALGDASGFSTESASFRMVSPTTTASSNGNGIQTAPGYRYVGFPIATGTSVPSNLLLSQCAGGYRWDEATRSWILIGGFDQIEGGRGYIVWTDPGSPLTLVTGSVAQGDQPMDLSFNVLASPTGTEASEGRPANYYAGSHIIANPYNAPISWDNVGKPNVKTTYRKWDGTQYLIYNSADGLGSAGATIYPFQAFGINLQSSTFVGDDIVFHEPPATSFVSLKSMVKAGPNPNAWALNIVARSGTAMDSENIVGVNPNAEDGWDPRDAEEPGHGADTWVLLYFDHNDWAVNPHDYTHDFRKPRFNAGEEIVWTGTLQTNSGAAVTLSWPNHGEMPTGDWQYFIEDPAAGTSVDMSTTTSIQIGPLAGPATVVIRARRLTSAGGTLGIAATPGGPAPATVAPGTSTVPMMAFDVLASGESITLQTLVVHHEGTGDPSKVQVSLFNGTARIAGPSSFDAGGTVTWGGLGQVLAAGAAQTWGLAYDFAADSSGTYRAALYGGEIEGLGNSSGLPITPAPTLLESSEVTVTTDAGTAAATAGTSGGGGGGGSCGLLGIEFIGVAALLWMKRRVGGRRRVGA